MKMNRRTFIASSISIPLSAKAYASPSEMRFMRLALVKFPGEPDRVEFEFSSDGRFDLVERYRLFALDPAVDGKVEAKISGPGYLTTNDPWSYEEEIKRSLENPKSKKISLRLRVNFRSDDNSSLDPVLDLDLRKINTPDGAIWTVKLGSHFWRNSDQVNAADISFGKLQIHGPSLLGVLRNHEMFWNVLGPDFIATTASDILALPIKSLSTGHVHCSLQRRNNSLTDVIFSGDWTVSNAEHPLLEVVRSQIQSEGLKFNFPKNNFNGAVLGALQGVSFNSTIILTASKDTTLRITPSDEQFRQDVVEVVSRETDNQTEIQCIVSIAENAIAELSHNSFELAKFLLPKTEFLYTTSKAPGKPPALPVLELSTPLKPSRIKVKEGTESQGDANRPIESVGLQGYTFGNIELFTSDKTSESTAVFRASIVGDKIASFEISGNISSLGVSLEEESDASSSVHSTLKWNRHFGAPLVSLRLIDTPVPKRVVDSVIGHNDDADEDRVVPVRQNAILLDWGRRRAWPRSEPFLDAPFNVSLEGATLGVRRDRDLLALNFRFHNFRLLSGPEGSTLRMEKAVALLQEKESGKGLTRPILTMEVPGGHILKESHRTQLISASDLPQPDNEKLMAFDVGGGEGLQGQMTSNLYLQLRSANIDQRFKIREEIQRRILETLEEKVQTKFEEFSEAFQKEAISRLKSHRPWIWLNKIPRDQTIYIGSDMMDRDLWDVARSVACLRRDDSFPLATEAIAARLRRADTSEVLSLRNHKRKSLSTYAEQTNVDVALSLSNRIPDHPDFASFNAFYSEHRSQNLPEIFPGIAWLEDDNIETSGKKLHADRRIELFGSPGKSGSGLLFQYFTESERFEKVSRSRLGGHSRLCFYWDTRETAEDDTNFSLSALLSWGKADLSVPLRARGLFEDDGNGRRRPIDDFAKSLEKQGIRPRQKHDLAYTSIARMGDVYRNATQGIEEWETSWELLSRIEFSFPEDSVLETRDEVPPELYTPEGVNDIGLPSWSVSLASDVRRNGLRAIASPDFNPLTFLAYAKQDVQKDTRAALNQSQLDTAYAMPPRHAIAPWARGRARVIDGEVVWVEPQHREEFQTALSPYHRHSLVNTSIAGRPTIGDILEIDENGNPINPGEDEFDENGNPKETKDTGSLPAPVSYILDDLSNYLGQIPEGKRIRLRQSILKQQNFEFSQVTISPFGPSINLNAPFQVRVPGRNTGDIELYEPTQVQQFDCSTTYGEDERTRVLEKGYLFPLGHKCTRVTQTSTAVIDPRHIKGRKYPATMEITRTWLSVSEPEKKQWYGQAFDGRERPFDRCRIVTTHTPDLVSPDVPVVDSIDSFEVDPTGRIKLGPKTRGLVFWPRIAEALAGTFRFEVIFDDGPSAVEMPLIFVDFSAATSETTLQRLCEYYLSIGNDSADESQQFLRQVLHGGARRRYANELRDLDMTYETESWIFGAEGRPMGSTTGSTISGKNAGAEVVEQRSEVFGGEPRTEFRFDALLAATDQPPFYPFLQSATVRCERIARQLGQRRGLSLNIAYDAKYLQRSKYEHLSASSQEESATSTDDAFLPPDNQADLVMGVWNPVKLDIGARGASVGAIGRPAGYLTGLARREGPLLYKAPIIEQRKTNRGFSVRPTKLSKIFSSPSVGDPSATERPVEVAKAAPSSKEVMVRSVSEKVDDQPPSSLGDLVCDMLGDPDMKILGVIGICEFVKELIGSLADNVPVFQEIQDYGQDLLDDVQEDVITPLRTLVAEINERLKTTITGRVTPARLLPELSRSLKQFEAALVLLEKTGVKNDRGSAKDNVLNEATQVVASGKSVVRALENVAEDPVSPLRTGLRTMIEDELDGKLPSFFFDLTSAIPELFEDLDELAQKLEAIGIEKLRKEFLTDDDLLNPQLKTERWTNLLSTGLTSAVTEAGLGAQLNDFVHGSLEAAVVTTFKNGTSDNYIEKFEELISQLDPKGQEGKDKWDSYAKNRIEALGNLLKQAEGLLNEQANKVLLDQIEQYSAVERAITSLSKSAEVKLKQFEDAILVLEAELAAAEDDAKAIIDSAIASLNERKTLAEKEIEKAKDRVNAQLVLIRDDLVQRMFGLDIKTAKGLFDAAEHAVNTITKIENADAQTIVSSIANLLSSIDNAYFAGTYTQQINSKLNESGQDIVRPIHRLLCLAIDYINGVSGWISKAPAQVLPEQKVIRDLFKGLNDGTKSPEFSGIIPKVEILGFGQGGSSQSPDVGEAFGEYLKILHNFLNEVDGFAQTATAEGHVVLSSLLRTVSEDFRGNYFTALNSFESYLLALTGALRTRDGTSIKCPSQNELLRQLVKGNLLETERAEFEASLSSWSALINETESLSRSLAAQVQMLMGSFRGNIRESLNTALDNLGEEEMEFSSKVRKSMNDAEFQLCDRLVRASLPYALILLRGTDRVLGGLRDQVLEVRAAALADIQKTLVGIKRELTEAGWKVPFLSPIVRLGIDVTDQLDKSLGYCETDQNSADLTSTIERLTAYASTVGKEVAKTNLLQELVTEVETFPDKLASVLLCKTPEELAVSEGDQPSLELATAHSANNVLTLIKAFRFEDEGFENALAKAIEDVKDNINDFVWDTIKVPIQIIAREVDENIYKTAISERNKLLNSLVPDSDEKALAFLAGELLLNINDLREIFVVIRKVGLTSEQLSTEKAKLLDFFDREKKFPDEGTAGFSDELLEVESRLVKKVALPSNPSGKDAIVTIKELGKIYGDRAPRPAILQIAITIEEILKRAISGDLSIRIDLADLKDEMEDILLRLIPTTVTNKMKYELELSEIGGIFIPKGDKKFILSAETKINLLKIEESPEINTRAELSRFDVALFGDAFDVFTMHFSGANFTFESGGEPDYDINFTGYTVGKEAEFIQELAAKMGAESGGVFIQPAFGFPGIEAGYRLNLPAITFGAANFLNVGLVASAILPFDNRQAFFSVGISTRQDPFLILIGVWGGGGHFALYSNGREMIGFDVSFVFAGGGEINAGPLKLKGRVSVGIFLRKIGELSEISGDFYAGGSGKIAIFGFSASLRVRVGQDGAGNMVGSAVFRFSFSVGFAKIRFAITLFKKEGKGLENAGGEKTAWLDGGSRSRQWASAGNAGPVTTALIQEAFKQSDIKGVASIEVSVPRFEDNFGEWRKNFANTHSELENCLREFDNA